MNKYLLPITYPTITTFTGYADTLAILQSHEKSLEWVYSHYIQIQANDIISRVNDTDDFMRSALFTASFFGDFDTRKTINAICDSIFLGVERCPYFNVFEIPNKYINIIDKRFCDFVKRVVDDGMYIYGYFDRSKISNYDSNLELGHQILIYGYDDSKQLIHFADFVDERKYSFSQCSYDEIECAFHNIDNVYLPLVKSVALIQYVESDIYTFDFSYIQDSIRDYISPNSKTENRQNNYTMSAFKPVDWITKTYMGVNVYNYFLIFIERELEMGKEYIDHRLFHAMYDHKEMMIKRMQYFLGKGYIAKDKTPQIESYIEVRDNALSIRNLVLKYNLTKSTREINKIKTLIEVTRPLEIDLLSGIFSI
jgi:hypothetical protein